MQAVGFIYEEISRSDLWRLISCAVRRQQVAVGPADRRERVEAMPTGSGWVQARPADPTVIFDDSSPFRGAFYASEPCLP